MNTERMLILRLSSLATLQDDKVFTHDELAIANAFKLAKRRDEWLLSRAAAKQLAIQLGLASDPRSVRSERPTLVIDDASTQWHVSLSHSAPYAAAAIDRHPIGIDIQIVRDLSESASHLFLSDEEADAMRRCAIAHRVIHFWCAKEAAWKQRSHEFTTMKRLPIRLVSASASGLLFDVVETTAMGDLVVALTRPTS